MRHEETPDLFGCGVGVSTVGKITCDLCRRVYNKDNETADGEIIDHNIEGVRHAQFAGVTVAECCFERIENSVLYRMDDILRWFIRIIIRRRESIEGYEAELIKVAQEIQGRFHERNE